MITISSQTFFDGAYQYGGSTATVRIYANKSFIAADGTVVPMGRVGSMAFFKAVACTILSGTLTIPSFTVPSTTDALDDQTARFTFVLYDHKNSQREILFANIKGGQLAIPSNLGSSLTFAQIALSNQAQQPLRDTSVYTKTETNTQISLAAGTLNDASDAIKGRTRLSVAPASSADPVAVGDNDPRVPLQDENDALAGTDGTPSAANAYVTDSDARNSDARTPIGAAGGSLIGTYPNPTFANGSVTESQLSFSDVATANSNSNAHGLSPKLPNDPNLVYLGNGVFGTVPASDHPTGITAGTYIAPTVTYNAAGRALSASSNIVTGTVVFSSAGTAAVTFNAAQADTNYSILFDGGVNETFWATSKATGGFTANSSNAASTAATQWVLVRRAPTAVPDGTPTNLTTSVVSATRIDLNWVDNSTNEDGFLVERCSGPTCSSFTQIAVVSAGSTSYSDVTTASQTTYGYRVRGFTAGGNSAYTNISYATTPAGALDPLTLTDLLNYYKADALSLANGDAVSSWTNSGSGSAATQGTGSLQPTFVTSAINSKPAVRFSGTTWLGFTARTTVRTVYLVIRHDLFGYANPEPVGIGHSSVADWVGNQGTRLFATSSASVLGGTAHQNGMSIGTTYISKTSSFEVYSFVTTGNTSLDRIGTDRGIYFLRGDVAEVVLCSTAHDNSTRQGVESFLKAKYGITSPRLIIADGDSLTADRPLFGQGVGSASNAWVTQMSQTVGATTFGDYDTMDVAVGGQKWADLNANAAARVDAFRINNGRPSTIVIAMAGTNDLPVGNLSLMQSGATTYYTNRRNNGTLVIAVTIPARGDGSYEATRLAYNTWLRANYTSFADGLADVGLDARMMDADDLSYFTTDKVHLTSAGLAVVAEIIGDAVFAVSGITPPSSPTFVDPNSYQPSIWFKADALTGLSDNDPVATLTNSSTVSSTTLTQSTAGNKGIYKTGLLNGKPGIRFDGIDDFYNVTQAQYRTIFVIMKSAVTPFSDYKALLATTDTAITILNGISGTTRMNQGATVPLFSAYRDGASLAFVEAAGTSESGYDFAPITTYGMGSFVLSGTTSSPGLLGSQPGFRFWNGDVLELIVYPRRLTDTERHNVEGYLCTKYALSCVEE